MYIPVISGNKVGRLSLEWGAGILLCLWFAGCASTQLDPFSSGTVPIALEADEQKIWQDADTLEKFISNRGGVFDDPELEAYLNELAKSLLGGMGTTEAAPRVKVLLSPYLNAFALPNGAVFIYSGMFDQMENEAQLATLLAHELTHFTHRHSVERERDRNNKAIIKDAVTLLVGTAGAGVGGGTAFFSLGENIGDLYATVAVLGYSREHETEADTVGFERIVAAGYDPHEAGKLFAALDKGAAQEKVQTAFFFSTHPRLQERINNYSQLVARITGPESPGERREEFRYAQKTCRVVLENAALELKMGRLESSIASIDRLLTRFPENARAHWLKGESLVKLSRDDVHRQLALAEYQQAAQLNPTNAEPYREIGLLMRGSGRKKESVLAFRRYLELKPKAVDGMIIEDYIRQMQEDSTL